MNPTSIEKLQWGRIRDAQCLVAASRSTYYHWIATGAIRARRINGARYIDMQSLKALFATAPERPSAKVSREMTKRAFASADARAARNGK
jgi:hypothetical protein